ncbi:WYL domain-containing protein [Mumia sp. zg.B17]|uniref:helix-turn-helix transcriptional regulator n=1 Tax=Mumia sp. zg.B17 TaxID=2855446 RepID=UPI001C6EFF18|nr:WYL domain-containing protein [Mumia sp. zg.B17]MBW9204978.1 WYL domain-containing protein [Mumia sp. zg.B17]
MRADRLVATLLLMQSRGQVTAAEVASELEVSVATARRDLTALSSAGVPVYARPGRHGGWSLVGGARTDLTGLTASEARTLFLLAGPAASGSPELKAALRKLVRALPRTFREDAEAAAEAVHVDATPWGGADRSRPPLVERLQDAVVRRRRVRLVYEGRGGETERLVDPWGLVDKDDRWYLLAGTERGRRTFRVDRVRTAEVTDESAERPDDLALEEAWADVVTTMERRRSLVSAVVLVDRRFVPVLRDHFGQHCTPKPPAADGRARVRVAAHTAVSVAEQLAGWGARVEVVEGDAVKEELRRIGAELLSRYGER